VVAWFQHAVAVAVRFIALAGVAAKTGVIMLIYVDHAMKELQAELAAEGKEITRAELNAAIMLGAVERVRPKMMTVVTIMAGLLPIMGSTGTGSEIMQRIAVSMIGSIISSTLLTPIVIPAIFGLVKGYRLPRSDSGSRHHPITPVAKKKSVPIGTMR
jgi:Cu(I)/Ag(I) efflux system membrane protein CusA/SilA